MNGQLIFAKITREGEGTYIQPLSELNVFTDEICETAMEDLSAVWHISFIAMTRKEYEALPEFMGH